MLQLIIGADRERSTSGAGEAQPKSILYIVQCRTPVSWPVPLPRSYHYIISHHVIFSFYLCPFIVVQKPNCGASGNFGCSSTLFHPLPLSKLTRLAFLGVSFLTALPKEDCLGVETSRSLRVGTGPMDVMASRRWCSRRYLYSNSCH